MAFHPAIARAAQQIARVTEPRDLVPGEWRDRALRADREVTAPLMRPARRCVVEDVLVPVPGQDAVRLRLYSPINQRPRGALLHFFGGAFRQGGLHFPSTDTVNRSRAARAGIMVAAVDYALAPESRFPRPIDQGLAALTWLRENAPSRGFSSASVAIGGLSAGGDIAAAVAIADRDAGGDPLRLLLLEAPVLDLTGAHFDRDVSVELGLPWADLEQELMAMADLYLAGADPTDPLASPLRSPRLDGLPPAHVFTAGLDVFRGDGHAFVEAIRASGGTAEEHRYAEITHDSHFFDKELPEAARWQRHVVQLLRTLGDALVAEHPQPPIHPFRVAP